jgi:hypothetical protein
MNKYAMGAAAAGLALPMFGLFASTAAADTTLVLFEHDTFQHQSDLGAPGQGPGDQFVFAGDVFDRPGGMFLGTAGGNCTEMSSNNRAEQTVCTAMLNLAGGQLVVQGKGDLMSGDTHPLTILGGNGIYTNATGTGTVQIPQDVPNQADANFVLNMTGG